MTGSVNTSPVTYADSTLTFSVTISDNRCVLTRLLDPGIADIQYTVDSHSADSVRLWNEFIDVEGNSDTTSGQSCGARVYDWPDRWVATPPISDYFTFNASGRSLTVATTDPARVGTHTLKFSAQQAAYPVWNPVSTIYKYIVITIDAICHDTIFYFTRREILHEASKATDTCITFNEPQDSESLRSLPGGDNGLTYCRARTYSFTASADLSSVDHSSPSTSLNSFNGSTRTFCVLGGASIFGTYEALIRITVNEYPGADFSAQEHIIDFKITPTCSVPVWTGLPTAADLNVETAVNEIAVTKTFTAVSYTEDGVFDDYCGDPVYSLVGGDTAYLTFDPDTLTISVYTDDTSATGIADQGP